MGEEDTKEIDDMFFTVTMGEVLEAQGKLEDALAIYTVLSRARPGDRSIEERIIRLKNKATGGGNISA